jgi:protein ImuB
MFACVYIPDFPLQAVLRSQPHLRGEAVVVLNTRPPLYTVAAANAKARQSGIQIGMTRLQAETCPGAKIYWRSEEEELATQRAMLECAQSISPCVEVTVPDTLMIDIAGLGHLFGPPEQIAQRLAKAARNLGLEINLAVAVSPQAAALAARGITGIVVISPGEEARYLNKLPIQVLQLAPEMAETLDRWGIRTSGDLAVLPEIELSERLGQDGLRLQAFSRGAGSRPLVPYEDPLTFEEDRELEYALETLEPLSFVMSGMLAELCTRLAQHSLAASQVCLSLELDSRAVRFYERTFKLSVPTRDSKVLLKLMQLNLEAHPPEAAIVKVKLALEPAKPRITQHGFFVTSGPEPQKLELALTRIANLLGEERVGSPELLDTHYPDSFRVVKFRGRDYSLRSPRAKARGEGYQPCPFKTRSQNKFSPLAVMRRFRPPARARVWLREGRPISLSFLGRHGKVIAASGPWRTTGDWWRDSRWQRDEWEVAANLVPRRMSEDDPKLEAEVALYRISYDLGNSRWVVEGSYD